MWPFRSHTLPTADLYLHIPMQEFLSPGWHPSSERPIVRLGPHLYFGNGRAVLVRYATRMELWLLARLRPERCAWLIDDNLWALDEDAALPEDYRNRLMKFRERIVPRILAVCDTVMAPSEIILRHFPNHRTLLLHPCSVYVCTDFSHFDRPAFIEVVFAGTRSHLPDLLSITDSLWAVVEKRKELRLTTFLGHHAPDVLKGHERIIHLPPMPWEHYRETMCSRRFHLGIAVFRNTLFNRSRSVNKILDHAAFGAAGVYADAAPFSSVVNHGENGVLVTSDADLEDVLLALTDDLEKLRVLAEQGARLALQLGSADRSRSYWMNYFRIAGKTLPAS